MSVRLSPFSFGAAFVASVLFTAAQSQNSTPAGTREDCVVLRSKTRMQVVDDKTILFFVGGRNGDVFRNDVQGVCPGLRRNRTITYAATSSRIPRLCKNDLINVVDTSASCPLGDFRLISAEEAANLTRRRGVATDTTERTSDEKP
jgi:hypothetical protein